VPARTMDVHDVSRLARLELTVEEEESLGRQLGQILEYVTKLSALDVTGVEPMAHAHPRLNVMRGDEVVPGLEHELAMRNAPEAGGGLFMVPRIVE